MDDRDGRLIEIEKFEIRMFVFVSCSCGVWSVILLCPSKSATLGYSAEMGEKNLTAVAGTSDATELGAISPPLQLRQVEDKPRCLCRLAELKIVNRSPEWETPVVAFVRLLE